MKRDYKDNNEKSFRRSNENSERGYRSRDNKPRGEHFTRREGSKPDRTRYNDRRRDNQNRERSNYRDQRDRGPRDEMIFGIHAIKEALTAGAEIDHIYVKRESNSELMSELIAALGEHRIPIRRVPIEKLNRLTKRNHQGIIAVKAATHYYRLEQVIPTLFEAGREPFIVVLDGVTDVRNFGAIARTCECTGVDAIVILEQNSVSVTADAVKTSAGALSRIAVCRERSLESALDYLKASGIKLVGATEKSSDLMYEAPLAGPLAIIMGAEDTGLSDYSLEQCDYLVRIPLYGEIGSLNVSVATGVLLYETIRQKREKNSSITN